MTSQVISYKIPSDIAKLGALTNVLSVSDTGNLGIGTTQPEETLHIDGGLRIDSNDVQKIEFDDTGQGNQHVHGTLSFATDTFTTPYSAKFTVATSSSTGAHTVDKFTVNGLGAIGIGTGPDYGTLGQVLTTNGPNSSVSWGSPLKYYAAAAINTTINSSSGNPVYLKEFSLTTSSYITVGTAASSQIFTITETGWYIIHYNFVITSTTPITYSEIYINNNTTQVGESIYNYTSAILNTVTHGGSIVVYLQQGRYVSFESKTDSNNYTVYGVTSISEF